MKLIEFKEYNNLDSEKSLNKKKNNRFYDNCCYYSISNNFFSSICL